MKRWNIRKQDDVKLTTLSSSLDISPVLARLLINRGLVTAGQFRTFLDGDIAELYNPFLMEGVHEAVTRIRDAIEKKEKVLIHGDYDVDGVTAIALLTMTLRNFGLAPYYYIPDRISDGYGLSSSGVSEAIRVGASLVITVDCGISSVEEVRALNEKNIDVIITDHHQVPSVLPPAYTVINPLQEICHYPDKNLSGVAIAFKLCEALCAISNRRDVWKHLDLVALGTVADVAPLTGENRILVKKGLKLLEEGTSNKGIRALIEVSGLRKKTLGSFEIGFILGPRINAIGRIGSADKAVKLLLTDDEREAEALARDLNQANRERQRIESSTLKEAMAKIDREVNFKDHKVIVLHNEDWHTGVIGIVASRITDRFYRPTIVISTKEGLGRGSGRSIENFHLFEALTGCEDVLKEFGGHKYACGLTIMEKNLEQFKRTINEIAHGVLTPEDLIPSLDIDMEIDLKALDYDLVKEMEMLEPFGEQNPEPVFCSRDLELTQGPRIIKGEHIKIWVTDGTKNFEAIGFGLAREADAKGILNKSRRIDLAYAVSFNTWQGLNSIQLRIEDLRPSGSCLP